MIVTCCITKVSAKLAFSKSPRDFTSRHSFQKTFPLLQIGRITTNFPGGAVFFCPGWKKNKRNPVFFLVYFFFFFNHSHLYTEAVRGVLHCSFSQLRCPVSVKLSAKPHSSPNSQALRLVILERCGDDGPRACSTNQDILSSNRIRERGWTTLGLSSYSFTDLFSNNSPTQRW